MLQYIAATVGGLCKDTVVGINNVTTYIVDEISSIPDAFSTGYDHGLITGPEDALDHHIEVEETLAEKHGSPFRKAK